MKISTVALHSSSESSLNPGAFSRNHCIFILKLTLLWGAVRLLSHSNKFIE